VEDGLMALDDPLVRFFPQVPSDKRDITIHQLLTHTAGLAARDAADRVTEREVAVNEILSAPLARTPGSGYGYTNDAYSLVAAIVETAAEEPYERHVRRVLLQPAGLTRTGFWGPLNHPEVASILPPSWGDAKLLQSNWGYRGARGMYATARDLHAWYIALRGHRLLSPFTVERLFTRHAVTSSNNGVGYGWFVSQTVRGKTSLWTRGNQGSGHGALLAAFPEDGVVMTIVSNSDRFAPEAPMGHRLATELSALIFGPG
jgi:CubicO group peptidase (beta-lactamase class C family)